MKRASLSIVAAGTAAAIVLAACAKTSTTAAPASSASDGSVPTVKIMVGGLSKQIYLPFTLAKQLGFYGQHGVNVQLFDEPAGVDATTAMLAGQVDGTGGFYDHTIDIQAKGKDTESVVSMLQVPGEVELCRTDLKGTINSPADWKGRNLGITDPGSSTDFLTQYLGVKNGVQPSQTTRLGVQAGPTFIAAMQHKQIDCGMTSEPTISALVGSGQAYVLADMRTAEGAKAALGGTYPATSLYMPTAYVQSHQATVQKVVSAFVQTLQWIQTHTAQQIADQMPADFYAGVGKPAYVAALDSEKGIFNPTGIMPADGPPTCLSVLSSFNADVKGKSIDLAKTFTNQFVQAAA